MSVLAKARYLRLLSPITGLVCVIIGLAHVAFGVKSVIGIDDAADPTVDSQERFFGGLFAGYGAAWMWAARRSPIPSPAVRSLSAAMALGGVGRVLSMMERGKPHRFWIAMTAVELGLPALFAWLSDADEERLRPNLMLASENG